LIELFSYTPENRD